MAILASYTCERKLGGVVGLSGWLPLHQKFAAVSLLRFDLFLTRR